jgi:cell division cycle 20, cofactor of APC complex
MNRTYSARLRQSQRLSSSASTASLGPSTTRPRLLSASSSFSDLSSFISRGRSRSLRERDDTKPRNKDDMELIMGRSQSVDTRASSIGAPSVTYSAESAKYHLRPSKVAIDFSAAPAAPEGESGGGGNIGISDGDADSAASASAAWPASWGLPNTLFFGRGNRVYSRNMAGNTNEDVVQLFKIKDRYGALRLLEAGGADQPHVLASATARGSIALWDVTRKAAIVSWQTKGVLAMRWNGPVLTVGGPKGVIKHYDTRIGPTAKMKEQTSKVTRHQAGIASLAWNTDGKLLASGDQTGTVYCWDARQNAPLDVGELVQRRKKMQHVGVVTVRSSSPL